MPVVYTPRGEGRRRGGELRSAGGPTGAPSDVLLLVRGGGSIETLAVNEALLAPAIRSSGIRSWWRGPRDRLPIADFAATSAPQPTRRG